MLGTRRPLTSHWRGQACGYDMQCSLDSQAKILARGEGAAGEDDLVEEAHSIIESHASSSSGEDGGLGYRRAIVTHDDAPTWWTNYYGFDSTVVIELFHLGRCMSLRSLKHSKHKGFVLVRPSKPYI